MPRNLALPVGIGRYPIMMIAGVSAGQQMFVALLNPAHRVIELKRQRREYDFLGIEPGLWSKSTTHIGRDDSDTTLLEPENFAPRAREFHPSATRSVCGVCVEA